MNQAIRISVVAAAVTLCHTLAAWAQHPTAPFTGVVNADDVYLRAGPGETYYHVGKLNEGDIVEVGEILFGWYMVVPPAGQFSYISKQFVEVADGNSGRVTGDDVRVRAPSPAGPGQSRSYKIQLRLDRNAEVKILGEEQGWYRIEPPDGAMLYISGDFVDKATEAQIAAARAAAQPAAAPNQPTEPVTSDAAAPRALTEVVAAEADMNAGTTTTEVVAAEPGSPDTAVEVADANAAVEAAAVIAVTEDTAAATEAAPAEVGDANAAATPVAGSAAAMPEIEPSDILAVEPSDPRPVEAAQALSQLDSRFATAAATAPVDRPVAALLADYRAARAGYDLTPGQSALVEARISVLQAWRDLQRAQRDLAAARAAAPDPNTPTTARPVPDYTAVGKLMASTLYTGDQRPLLYRLVDPLTGLTIGYVEPREDRSLRLLLGQVVGIVGKTRYEPGLKLNVITVQRADALSARSR